MKSKPRQLTVRIDPERCKACGLCLEYCPQGALRISESYNRAGLHPLEVADTSACAGCGFCARVCPDAAIEIVEE